MLTPTSTNPAIVVSPVPAQEEQFHHLDTANSTDFSRGDINASDELFVNLNATVEQQPPSSGNEHVAAVSDELFASSGTGNEHLASFDTSYDQLAERNEGNEYSVDPIEIADSSIRGAVLSRHETQLVDTSECDDDFVWTEKR